MKSVKNQIEAQLQSACDSLLAVMKLMKRDWEGTLTERGLNCLEGIPRRAEWIRARLGLLAPADPVPEPDYGSPRRENEQGKADCEFPTGEQAPLTANQQWVRNVTGEEAGRAEGKNEQS
jgi:hypothetical protein